MQGKSWSEFLKPRTWGKTRQNHIHAKICQAGKGLRLSSSCVLKSSVLRGLFICFNLAPLPYSRQRLQFEHIHLLLLSSCWTSSTHPERLQIAITIMPRCASSSHGNETASHWLRMSFHSLTCHADACRLPQCQSTKKVLGHIFSDCTDDSRPEDICRPIRSLLLHYCGCQVRYFVLDS